MYQGALERYGNEKRLTVIAGMTAIVLQKKGIKGGGVVEEQRRKVLGVDGPERDTGQEKEKNRCVIARSPTLLALLCAKAYPLKNNQLTFYTPSQTQYMPTSQSL